ncbi:MAG TPA: MFS transporter [Candidatus Megaira endosymbiont of Nemacystus decipiens]|nr:MFS transporter [Candidatus Megaera endosymbiont of Nemacystus decipiens]
MNKHRSIFLSAISGNILEYYDFTVYAVFSVAIGKSFFPHHSDVAQILLSLAVFAMGFITRPIGGVIFGYVADKYGRKTSLIISMLGMTLSTFMIGLMPDYNVLGYFASGILVLMRLFQGLCISGEGAGAAIFILEHYENLRPGMTAGLVHASNIAGTLLATIVGIILSYYYPDLSYTWRIAFIIGGLMGIVGFYFRLRVSETPIFLMLSKQKKTLKMPFLEIIKTSKKPLFITCCLGACASSTVYLIKTYINIYHCNVLHFHDIAARSYLAYSSVIMMITMPISGYISDIIGRFKMVVLSAISVFTLALPCFILISSKVVLVQLASLTLLALIGGMIAGCAYLFVISLFSPAQRFSGVAFSYNLGIALCGGTSAAISRWLVEATSLHYAPAFYIMCTSALFLAVAHIFRHDIRALLNQNFKK